MGSTLGRVRNNGQVRVRAPELTGRGWLNTAAPLQPPRPPWPLRAARLLDVLLHQLPARPRRAAPDRGGVRRRAGRHRRPLAEVRARGRPGRRWSAAVERYGVHHPVLDDPELTDLAGLHRAGLADAGAGRPRGLRRRAVRRRGSRARDRRAAGDARRGAPDRRARSSRATRRTSRRSSSPTDLRFPAKAVPLPDGRRAGRRRRPRRGRAADRRRRRRAAGSTASASPTACACCPPSSGSTTTSSSPTPSATGWPDSSLDDRRGARPWPATAGSGSRATGPRG